MLPPSILPTPHHATASPTRHPHSRKLLQLHGCCSHPTCLCRQYGKVEGTCLTGHLQSQGSMAGMMGTKSLIRTCCHRHRGQPDGSCKTMHTLRNATPIGPLHISAACEACLTVFLTKVKGWHFAVRRCDLQDAELESFVTCSSSTPGSFSGQHANIAPRQLRFCCCMRPILCVV